MKTKIQVGSYIILNGSEQPCTRLVVRVTEVTENHLRGYYICEPLKGEKVYGELSLATHICDFGVELQFTDKTVTGVESGQSIATYQDGKVRCWQPGSYNRTQVLHRFTIHD